MEIRWIYGDNNPVDAIIKAKPNRALETFINKNKLIICIKG